MLVYRLCKEDEVRVILEKKKYKNVGKCFKINPNANTHKYQESVRYLHFFNKKDSIFYFDTCEGYYVCTYDIPYLLLDNYCGTGFYLDRMKYHTFEQVIEYAIPSNLIQFEYLLKIQEITHDITFDDYLYNNISNKLLTIYEKPVKNINNKGRLVLIRRKKKD